MIVSANKSIDAKKLSQKTRNNHSPKLTHTINNTWIEINSCKYISSDNK